MLDFLAGLLTHRLTDLAATGLHRDYVERAEPTAFVQGQLDVTAQLREVSGRKERVHCRYDDFTADVPCNQIPRATAELLLASPLLAEPLRSALRQALMPFAQVQPMVLSPDSFRLAERNRVSEPYRPMLDLCRLLAESLQPGSAAGAERCPAFLLNLERVFEQYVSQGVARVAQERGLAATLQPLFTLSPADPDQPALHLRPDLVLDRVVLDVKWKRAAGCPLLPADVYQVSTYASFLGVHRAVLVYPGRRDHLWQYRLPQDRLRLEVRTLRVVGSRRACERSLRRLGRAVCVPGL
jgi:5-methylcytosine-specific restriction enzyme subunit McrC